MVRFYHWHVGGGVARLAWAKSPFWLAVLSAGQHLSHRLVGEGFSHWVDGAAAGLFGHKRAGPQTKWSIGGFVAEHKKPLGLLPRAREEREERGLTYSQMAEVLGLGEHQVESGAIKGYESGMPVSNGSVVRIYQELQRARLQSQTWLKVPRFTLARDADSVVLHHNDWPRFVAKAVPEALHKEQWRFAKAGMPVYELRPETGLSQAIFSFIDHVPADFDAEEVLEEAVVAIEAFCRGDSSGQS